ncbi:hypothetical protein [Hydrogenophaga sp. 2FB]|uniref:hypothetical protein n=1 Tax=Hydrogenophaga sp. 2FB TaxID=2502187 RepID=UPI0010F65918|nr:hypothetical protein [Hydrogenophaga sp. 2FB]
MGFFETILAGLIVTGIAGAAGRYWGARSERKRFAQKREAAVKQFAAELKKLIAASQPASDQAMIDARAIVSTRNSLRAVLTSLAASLNSEIDRMEELIGEGKVPTSREGQIRETLSVLKRTWPAKETELDVAVRKLITELGLDPEQ